MRSRIVPALLSSLALAAPAACGSNGGSGGSGGASGAIECNGSSITASETNNYSFQSTLSFPPTKIQPKSNLTFDWGGVTADLIRHPIDPKKDLNSILVFEWNLTLESLQTKLNADALDSIDMTAKPPLSYATNGSDTTAKLLDFGLNGSKIGADGGLISVDQVMLYFDPSKYDPASHVFTLMATSGNVLGQGTRMIQSFLLDPSSTNTTVTMTKDSTKLDYTANIHDLTPTGISPGKTAIVLDWGKMKKNALGNDFDTTAITRAIVAHYTQALTEVEKKFLDLELIATDLYQDTIDAGTKVDFSSLKASSGKSFPGIDGTGTWIVALQCGACRNPAPWYLTVLKPCN